MLLRIMNQFYLTTLRSTPYRPKLEVLQRLGDFYISNLGDTSNCTLAAISEHIASGMDRNINLAVAKSISEYIERLAFRLGQEQGRPEISAYGTEGFAAYPKLALHSLKTVRMLSLYESIEKFAWPYFWHHSVGFDTQIGDVRQWQKMCAGIDISELLCIYPHILSTVHLCICIGRISRTGVIVGGACGPTKRHACDHAMGELIRHFIAIKNMKNGYEADHIYYGQRLKYLASHGYELYRHRLRMRGKKAITLPSLHLDHLVTHPFDKVYHVYRTRFNKQRCFIDSHTDVGYI